MAEQLHNLFLRLSHLDLNIELSQLQDEGKKIPPSLRAVFDKLQNLDHEELFSRAGQDKASKLLDKTIALPVRKDFPFVEPSDLKDIRKLRPNGPRQFVKKVSQKTIADSIHGAWLGRCIGCFLGKAAEGLRTDRFWPFLEASGQWPISDYIRYGIRGKVAERYSDITKLSWIDRMDYMPVDDDTNYTTTGLLILKRHGPDFAPVDVAQFWMENIPLLATFTAERVAYNNFAQHIQPPHSASYRNPYREWIGAQIRADALGYVNAGNPERAAEFAWRDACISHVKNGIYGEMFVAAMIAAAPYCKDIVELIEVGLSEIPRKCRLTAAIKETIDWHRQGLSYDEAVAEIHAKWDEYDFHHWCLTIPNAVICVVALLWGEDDFGKSICRAVQPGFDTDCNGATVGSIMGMRLGTAEIESKWTDRLNDTLHTSLAGYNVVKISHMAEETFKVFKNIR
jgi:ADP-ribosylglycohydrolase